MTECLNFPALHTPIDSLILKSLNRTLTSARRLPTKWSTFDAKAYQQAIEALRLSTEPLPLWTAESLWQGHRCGRVSLIIL